MNIIKKNSVALLAAAFLIGLGSAVQAADDKQARDDMVRIVTQVPKPAECISRVAINRINGERTFVSPQGFDLEPGKYTMSGSVALNTTFCPTPQGRTYDDVPPLEGDFEAGKTYYIGFDHSARDRREWGYVVWKVE